MRTEAGEMALLTLERDLAQAELRLAQKPESRRRRLKVEEVQRQIEHLKHLGLTEKEQRTLVNEAIMDFKTAVQQETITGCEYFKLGRSKLIGRPVLVHYHLTQGGVVAYRSRHRKTYSGPKELIDYDVLTEERFGEMLNEMGEDL